MLIRNILSSAAASIDIKDDYLFSANATTMNIELLAILQPYLSTSVSLNVRLLGSSDELHNAVRSDVKLFQGQYPSVQIKGFSRSHSGDRETHDRFIVIDGSVIYKIGASIKDLGAAQSSIDRVNDSAASSSYIKQFDKWWSKATSYKGLN